MKSPRVHLVYEYGSDFRPHSSSYIRLIRPFSYPKVQSFIQVSQDLDYECQPVDLVIVDRLWRPDISADLSQALVERIRQNNARLIHYLDDNFFDLILENKGWPPPEFLPITEYFLQNAHGVVVSTPVLRERLLEYNPNILVLTNQLDERLLVKRTPEVENFRLNRNRLVIGYMGTFTHDEDFLIVLPALEAVINRHPGSIELQIIGAFRSDATRQAVANLPIRYLYPHPAEHEYPMFMPWFTGQVQWDIAIAPLKDTPFTRCKSDIKFLDYAAIGVTGIYSQSPAYSNSVHHRETGWLAENSSDAWEDALEALVNDSDLRLHIAQNANRHLHTERTLAQHATDWIDTVRQFLD